ncbi:MAG: aminotransferase class I/II-fold pyridoxal phosphate-dependent enzyme [Oscillospiraceae bacterium]|nr:aminotransferase class I/II-fold pyridoxal phosphate-dependent enzyme [Oscillospiraceae bacterium]
MIPLNFNLDPLQRSGIRRFTNMAKEVDGCVMLTIGEPDFATPEPIKAAAVAALAENQTHYAPNQGIAPLRQAIAAYETQRGMACTADQVLVTVGATGALFTALLGILNEGDEVIIPTPAFSLYETIATVAGAVPVALDLAAHDFQITDEALASVLTDKTKAIVLNSPNNPTGTVLSAESLAAVKGAVAGRDIYIVCDNVYNQLSYGPCPDLSLDPTLADQLLLCQSFSKPYAMTGWRVGYLVGPQPVMDRLLLLHAAQVAAVPTFVQSACVTALATDVSGMTQEYRRRRDYCVERLEKMGLHFPRPEGAFYIFIDIRPFGIGSEEFCTRLIRQARVAAVPGSCFGAEGFLRISYCCAMENLQKGMDRLEQFLNRL